MLLEVYADIVFLINFFMDFFIFYISGKFISKRISKKRLVLGAFISALLYCLFIFTKLSYYLYNPAGIAVIIFLSVYITFGGFSIKEFFKNTAVVLTVSFVFGGFASALFYFVNISDFIGNFINIYIHNFSLKFLVFSIAVFYAGIKLFIIWYKKAVIKKQTFYDIAVFIDDKKIRLKALVDTGNSLYEPISGKPVIVSEFEAIKDAVPDNFKKFFKETKNRETEKIYNYLSTDEFSRRIRIIPFSSLGKRKGSVFGFTTDKTIIYAEKELCIEKTVIGVYDFKLSEKNDYNALLNPELLIDKSENKLSGKPLKHI